MKLLLLLLLLQACAHKVRTDGGQAEFAQDTYDALSGNERLAYSQSVVKREERDPVGVTLEEMKKSPEGRIKKVGIVIFESEFQPSRSGLAPEQSVYLSPRGKQALTQSLYEFWNQNLRQVLAGLNVRILTRSEVTKAKTFRSAGFQSEDFLLTNKYELTEDDIFWKEGGARIPEESLLHPRDFQSVGLVLIPATNLMQGPKPSQHQNQWLNEVCKELELDAAIIVYAGANWTRGSVDKRTKEVIPEEMKLKVEASLFYPWKTYHKLGEAKGLRDLPKLNIPLAAYSVKTKIPLKLTWPKEEQNFSTSNREVLAPLRRTINSLSIMVIDRIASDIHQTHWGP